MRLSSLIQRIFDHLLSEGSLFGSNPGAPIQCADLTLHVPGSLPGVRLTVAGVWTSVPPASSLGPLVPWTPCRACSGNVRRTFGGKTLCLWMSPAQQWTVIWCLRACRMEITLYGYYDSSPSPVNVSKAVWNLCMPLAFENALKNANMWAVFIFIPVHLNFWPFFHSLFSNLFFSFLHFIETIAFTLLSFCQSFVAANIFGGFHKMCECQTRLKGSPGSPEDFKQVCCQSWWDLRWCQESWEAQLVLLWPLPGCLWRNQGILWWWPAWD